MGIFILIYILLTVAFPALIALLMCALITSYVTDKEDPQRVKFVKASIGFGISCILIFIAVFAVLNIAYGPPV